MSTYAKCIGSPWLLQIPAEDDEGKGKLRWEMGIGGHSLAASCRPQGYWRYGIDQVFFIIHFIADYTLGKSGSSHFQLFMIHAAKRCLLIHTTNTHRDNYRFICWQKRCIVEINIEHCCKFVVAQGCVLVAQGEREQGALFCGIFLVAVHERFSGHSVCTTLRRRIQSGQSVLYMYILKRIF